MLAYKSAWLADQGLPNTHVASMAKRFAADHCQQVTYEAVQVFGGAGFNTEYPVEKLMRGELNAELNAESSVGRRCEPPTDVWGGTGP